MKKIGFIVAGVMTLILASYFVMNIGSNYGKSEYITFRADSLTTSITWFGSNIGDKTHVGSVDIDTIGVTFKDCDIDEVFVKVNMNTIKSSEVEILGFDMSKKLVSHLKGEDFFNVERYPNATATIFGIKEVVPDSTDEIWNRNFELLPRKYECLARIHILDLVKDTTVVVYSDASGGYFWCPLSLDRTEYQIQYGSNKFYQKLGDNAINDEILVTISINLTNLLENQGCL